MTETGSDDENFAGVWGGLSSSASTAVAGLGGLGVLSGTTFAAKASLDVIAKQYRRLPELEPHESNNEGQMRRDVDVVSPSSNHSFYDVHGRKVGHASEQPPGLNDSVGTFAKYLNGEEVPIIERRLRTPHSLDHSHGAVLERGHFADGTQFEVIRGNDGFDAIKLRTVEGKTLLVDTSEEGAQHYADGKGYFEDVSSGCDRFMLRGQESRLLQALKGASSRQPHPDFGEYRSYEDAGGGGWVVGGEPRKAAETFERFNKYFRGHVGCEEEWFLPDGLSAGERYRFDDGSLMYVRRTSRGEVRQLEIVTSDGQELTLYKSGDAEYHDGHGYAEMLDKDSLKWTRPPKSVLDHLLPDPNKSRVARNSRSDGQGAKSKADDRPEMPDDSESDVSDDKLPQAKLPQVDLSSSQQADAEAENSADRSGTESHPETDESSIPEE